VTARAARWTEAGVVLGLVVLVGIAVLPAAVDAGWAADDWALAELVARRGYVDAVGEGMASLGARPLLAIAGPLPFAVLGTDPGTGHAVMTVVLGVATAVPLHLLLRQVGFRPWEAAAAAVLSIVFPWNLSARLWLTGSVSQLAVLALVLGILASLRAFTSTGVRGTALHVIGVTLLVASILTVEATAAVAVLSGALYLTVAPVRTALTRWAVDVVACGAAILWSATATVKDRAPLGDQIEQAGRSAVDAARLGARAVVPITDAGKASAVAIVVVVTVAVVRVWRRPAAPGTSELRTWLRRLACAIAAALAGWLPHVPAAYWTPLKPGLEDRVNVVASLGVVVAVVALLRVVGLLVASGDHQRGAVVAGALVAAVAVGYAVRFEHDADAWVAAGRERRAILDTIDRALDPVPAGSRVYVLDAPSLTGPGVPVFVFSYDLEGAVRTRFDVPTVEAHPALDGARFDCEAGGVRALWLPSPTYEIDLVPAAGARSAYGATWFVDLDDASATRVDDERSCASFVRAHDLR
jgi:hypothetical protein